MAPQKIGPKEKFLLIIHVDLSAESSTFKKGKLKLNFQVRLFYFHYLSNEMLTQAASFSSIS